MSDYTPAKAITPVVLLLAAFVMVLLAPPAFSKKETQAQLMQRATQTTYAYVANYYDYSLSSYSTNGDGSLTNIATVQLPTGYGRPEGEALDPTNRYMYVATDHATIFGYALDLTGGAISLIFNSQAQVGGDNWIAISPNGRFLYQAISSPSQVVIWSINSQNGSLVQVGIVGLRNSLTPWSIAVDPTGNLVYVGGYYNEQNDFVCVLSVDPSTGTLQEVAGSPFATGGGPHSIAGDPSGRFLYVLNFGTGDIWEYTINHKSGALVKVGSVSLGLVPQSVAVEPSGRFAYAVASNKVYAYTVNGQTGVLTQIGLLYDSGDPSSVVLDPSGRYVFASNPQANNVSVYQIQNNGTLQEIIGSPFPSGNWPLAISTTNGFLDFPLDNANHTINPQSASISAIFDHSQLGPYNNGTTVSAYTGESGVCVQNSQYQNVRSPAVRGSPHAGFARQDGQPFVVNGYYTGGGGSAMVVTDCSKNPVSGNYLSDTFLYYQGHPGYDYPQACSASSETPVYAAASGVVFYPTQAISPGYPNPSKFHILELDLDFPYGYKLLYLHMSTYPHSGQNTACVIEDPIIVAGSDYQHGTHVNAGQWIGNVGHAGLSSGNHLHFEVRNASWYPVDPYGWTGEIVPTADPYNFRFGVNTRLWKSPK